MSKINLRASKLLGFRLNNTGPKAGHKDTVRAGGKDPRVGHKMGTKVGHKGGDPRFGAMIGHKHT